MKCNRCDNEAVEVVSLHKLDEVMKEESLCVECATSSKETLHERINYAHKTDIYSVQSKPI